MASKNKKGLGRGINALFADFDEEKEADEKVEELQLDEIRPNPYQPRKNFDEENLKDLSDSIRKNGVFQPIIVRKSSVMGYEIIAGERRFRASKLAGKDSIPAIVRAIDDEQMMEVAVLENLQREDLSPLEEAEAYSTLMKNLKITQSELSERLGKSRPYIANYLRLLDLPREVKAFVQDGKLSMGQARTLLALKDKDKLVELAKKTVKENYTVRQLEQIVNDMNGKKKVKKDRKKKLSPYLLQSQDRLQEKFGTKVAIKANEKTGKGKIEINYLSTEDFNRILDVLNIEL
ncbi:ParB/RepB/Spo0J family partition protein [Ligilactobacillus aviarius]|uniref:ParB/RepB/Spo0J family partition protein n=1 Tax=Ligilactobacillus aviarius TaxID=1606 RepID=UPI0007DA2573|nr:ParB/RepB/Spo0J family partition protein [Ligilactobacillus aviarius]MBM6863011.1 ParB/RepB/Spo0J family partition protein [Ligilactobacillus aviarius]MDM8278655.1 ParB/RepB/Spo0J family partition protein [Ligilactobacillus aviarius]OAQ03310.1 chromosome partitioning protein ParB [Ligilactobacillus aviarius]OAQ04886.1 chromosome partitioning protein ParB [Ligilactobacillus aviarius]OAS77930.1 chromosome partitioning protein ParB [Ligilactobacillus aviarius]